ncbi:reverse transcriptase domain-containing protein [Tanacetum coccineum]
MWGRDNLARALPCRGWCCEIGSVVMEISHGQEVSQHLTLVERDLEGIWKLGSDGSSSGQNNCRVGRAKSSGSSSDPTLGILALGMSSGLCAVQQTLGSRSFCLRKNLVVSVGPLGLNDSISYPLPSTAPREACRAQKSGVAEESVGTARIWLEKEPPRSILTWDDLVSKFINQFFPPSKTTNLRNEITRFQQRFDESFYEAWDRFNDLLRACPHHGFSELHQLDTFYNALNANDQDSLNSVAGGNFLDKMPRECLKIIESKSKVHNSRNKAVVAKVSSNSSTPRISPDVAALTTEVSELKNMMNTMLIDK